MTTDDTEVTLENIKFIRATTISKDTKIRFVVSIHAGTGNFEVSIFYICKSFFFNINAIGYARNVCNTTFWREFSETKERKRRNGKRFAFELLKGLRLYSYSYVRYR